MKTKERREKQVRRGEERREEEDIHEERENSDPNFYLIIFYNQFGIWNFRDEKKEIERERERE